MATGVCFMQCLDPSELASEVKEIEWLRLFQPDNLIHLPGKLAGVCEAASFGPVAANLIHLPDKPGGVINCSKESQ